MAVPLRCVYTVRSHQPPTTHCRRPPPLGSAAAAAAAAAAIAPVATFAARLVAAAAAAAAVADALCALSCSFSGDSATRTCTLAPSGNSRMATNRAPLIMYVFGLVGMVLC